MYTLDYFLMQAALDLLIATLASTDGAEQRRDYVANSQLMTLLHRPLP